MRDNRADILSLEYLLTCFRRTDVLLGSRVEQVRNLHREDIQFRGLYVSEADVDALLSAPLAERDRSPESQETAQVLSQRLQQERELSRRSLETARQQGITPRLELLTTQYGLDEFETDVLLICLAPDVSPDYERLFGYLQDDVTKRRPTVDLILTVLLPVRNKRIASQDCFAKDAPLFQCGLLEICEESGPSRPSLLGRQLRVNARTSSYLFGSDHIDERLVGLLEVNAPKPRSNAVPSHREAAERIVSFVQNPSTRANALIYMQGPYGSGGQELAQSVCQVTGTKLLAIDAERLTSPPLPVDDLFAVLHRETFFSGAALLLRNFDALTQEEKPGLLASFLRSLAIQNQPVFCSGEEPRPPLALARREGFVAIDLNQPDTPDRALLWFDALNGDLSEQNAPAIQELATKFRFTSGQIYDAAQTARNLAGWKQVKQDGISPHDLYEACRMHSNHRIGSLARKVRTRNRWQDIVLPPDRLEQLTEICNQVKYREQVYGEWGFKQKLSYGTALTALFAGPSGTGKTMAAGIIAAELGLDLYKIDLSTVVSKYIGETEKNLAKIFKEAETSNAILFFDEADALFGKRSEVRDSHDRYANIETGYLLQRMEEYDGVAILATNFRRNMDEAFVRRLQFTIEFPLPSEAERLRIWQTVWPAATPLSQDLELASIARRFEISGGHIRNIALAAAFMAASEKRNVERAHLMKAMRRELQKIGKIISEGEFAVEASSLAG